MISVLSIEFVRLKWLLSSDVLLSVIVRIVLSLSSSFVLLLLVLCMFELVRMFVSVDIMFEYRYMLNMIVLECSLMSCVVIGFMLIV